MSFTATILKRKKNQRNVKWITRLNYMSMRSYIFSAFYHHAIWLIANTTLIQSKVIAFLLKPDNFFTLYNLGMGTDLNPNQSPGWTLACFGLMSQGLRTPQTTPKLQLTWGAFNDVHVLPGSDMSTSSDMWARLLMVQACKGGAHSLEATSDGTQRWSEPVQFGQGLGLRDSVWGSVQFVNLEPNRAFLVCAHP